MKTNWCENGTFTVFIKMRTELGILNIPLGPNTRLNHGSPVTHAVVCVGVCVIRPHGKIETTYW